MTFLCFRAAARPFFVFALLLCGVALLVASVLSAGYNLIQLRGSNSKPATYTAPNGYSYVGEDYPPYYPLEIRDVTLVPENTVHYGIAGSDADEEWSSVFPPGRGFVRPGRDGSRKFGISLYHQMHCLDRIRRAIGKGYNQHVHHCFNYLRQSVLCEADDTIEPGVPRLGGKVVKIGVRRTCKDWTQVYEAVAKEQP